MVQKSTIEGIWGVGSFFLGVKNKNGWGGGCEGVEGIIMGWGEARGS